MLSDVLSIYDADCRERQANKRTFDERMLRLNDWWGSKRLSEVTGATCRAYVESRKAFSPKGGTGGARRDLEDLRAAIGHHKREGLHRGEVKVALPAKGAPKERWLTRSEAAALLWYCWRTKKGRRVSKNADYKRYAPYAEDSYPLRHLARFILLGLYTGSRAGALASAAFERGEGRSYVDLNAGLFYRLAEGKQETRKRQPPVPISARLMTHIRIWAERRGDATHLVEFNKKPVQSVKTALNRATDKLGLEDVTPHTLRHTAATWMMQNGAETWEAAGFLGMSQQMVEKVYAHHHPEYQRDAANRLATGRKRPNVSPMNAPKNRGQKQNEAR